MHDGPLRYVIAPDHTAHNETLGRYVEGFISDDTWLVTK
jgi:hypothetical protein